MSGFQPPPMTRDRYPEHTKLINQRDKTETVNDFFEWLKEKHPDHALVRWAARLRDDTPLSLSRSEYDDLLAEWIGVDLKVVEKEKRAMLDEMRGVNG